MINIETTDTGLHTNDVDWNSFLSVFMFTILFINTGKINMKGKD